jgi:hypothetical protein
MSGNLTARSSILIVGLLVLPALVGCRQQAPSPGDLTREALEAATDDQQELAAVKLAEVANDEKLEPEVRAEARQCLRRVLGESKSPTVRVACIQGLASQWDYESMPAFLDALDDESELVRSRAVVTLERMMSVNLKGFGYDDRDPSAKRADAIARIRDYWDEKRETPIFINWMKRKKQP